MKNCLQTKLCNYTLKNPFVLASGIWGTSLTLLFKAIQSGAGAVTTKSVTITQRAGHQSPIHFDWGSGLINAVGLPGKGTKQTAAMITHYKEKTDVPLIASIFGHDVSEIEQACKEILVGNPDIIELNMSCPNVAHEYGLPFACDHHAAQTIIKAVKHICNKPIFAKLAPNVPNIANIAQACVDAGADGITAINTVPGMIIDVHSGQPILTNKSGGLSGPAIKPIALKAIYDIRKALPTIPIIGTGGVTTGIDALEMLMAGATVVSIGSAVYYRGTNVFTTLTKEVTKFMKENKYNTLDEIKNLAHQ